MLDEFDGTAQVAVSENEALNGLVDEVGLITVGSGSESTDLLLGGEENPRDLHRHI